MRKFLILLIFVILTSAVHPQSGWINLNSGVSYELRGLYFINENTGWVIGFSSNVLKTTNGGLNWISQNTNWNGYLSVYFINDQTGWIGGGNESNDIAVICKTTNGGNNWFQIFYANTGVILNMSFINSLTGWFACSMGNILKTTDGGNTFMIKNVSSYDFAGIHFINQNTGWISGSYGRIYKTSDGGLNWMNQSYSTVNLHTVCMINGNIGFIGGLSGRLIKTTNGGNNWVEKPHGNNNWINQIIFRDNNTGYLCGGTYGGSTPMIMVTTNAGENWINQTVPVSNWIGSIQFVNQNTGFAAGQGGKILKTTTGGYNIPAAPVLVSPANNSINITPTPTLTWNSSSGATKYKVEISTVPIFSVISDSATITSTNYSVPAGKLSPGYTYYWRVNASNSYGISPWSSIWNFSTSVLPPAPVLISPPNGALGVILTPTLLWDSISGSLNYHVEISTVPDFAIITDSATRTTNQYTVPAGKLINNITYYWKVRARNSFGWGPYSVVWHFIPYPSNINLISSEIPGKFMLHPNYPNPFNPDTKINFDIAQTTNVKIVVYDISGRAVANLVNGRMSPGKYSMNFSGKNLSTGIYYLRFETEYFTSILRLALIK